MSFSSSLSPDTGASSQDVSRCPHCGKLFRGARSTISLQEHITNIHAAVAPISKSIFAQQVAAAAAAAAAAASGGSPPSAANSFKFASLFGHLDEMDGHQHGHNSGQVQACPKCSQTFECKEDYEKHQLLHLSSSLQVRGLYENEWYLVEVAVSHRWRTLQFTFTHRNAR